MAPLLAVRATGSTEIQENSEKLFDLCPEMGEARLLAQVLLHLFFSYLSAMDLEKAATFARQAFELAEHSSDEYQIFCGNFVAGFHTEEKGEYLSARLLLESASAISDPAQHAILADPRTALGMMNCIGRLAIVLWILGYPDQARQRVTRMVTLLDSSLDPMARTLAISHILTICRDLLRDDRVIHLHVEDALARSMQSGLRFLSARGLISLGRIMVAEGSVEAGAEKIAEGMLAFRAAGDNYSHHLSSYPAISSYLAAHRVADGIALIELTFSEMERIGMRLFEPDLHRLQGEFILMAGRRENEAEAVFRDAITIARQRQAKSFELRATMSLARLLAKQGHKDEANAMLADIYGWFTEGFDTPDLKDAKALLEELAT